MAKRKRKKVMDMKRKYQIVCEGACNPGIAELDRATNGKSKKPGTMPPPPNLPYKTLEKIRNLAHTPHSRVDGERVSCDVCGHEREW
jgi:hypothetical protein